MISIIHLYTTVVTVTASIVIYRIIRYINRPVFTEVARTRWLGTSYERGFPRQRRPSTPVRTGEVSEDAFSQRPSWLLPTIHTPSSGMEMVGKCLCSRWKAPDPDGVPGKVLALTLGHMGGHLRQLFDRCLLAIAGRPPDCLSAYRSLVLLDDTGKLRERIMASRVFQIIMKKRGLI